MARGKPLIQPNQRAVQVEPVHPVTQGLPAHAADPGCFDSPPAGPPLTPWRESSLRHGINSSRAR